MRTPEFQKKRGGWNPPYVIRFAGRSAGGDAGELSLHAGRLCSRLTVQAGSLGARLSDVLTGARESCGKRRDHEPGGSSEGNAGDVEGPGDVGTDSPSEGGSRNSEDAVRDRHLGRNSEVERMRTSAMCSVLVVALAGVGWAELPPGYTGGLIDEITVADVAVDFAPGGVGSSLTFDAHPGHVTVRYADSSTDTFWGEFDWAMVLANDWSSGGKADGWFTNGSFALAYGSDDLLAGDVDWYRAAEDASGVLTGVSSPISAVGLLVDKGDWPGENFTNNQITFTLDIDLDSFGSPFTATATVHLIPDDRYVPEPATLSLLALGAAAAMRRRR